MLKIRLQRVGRKNDPSFRVVVMQKQKDSQSGKFIEILGAYNARYGEPQLNAERIKYWISVGAQVSPTVHNLLIEKKITTGKKINVLPRKSPPPTEAPLGSSEAIPRPLEELPSTPVTSESAPVASDEAGATSDVVEEKVA